MGLRKYSIAWTMVAVMDANASPYEIANVDLSTRLSVVKGRGHCNGRTREIADCSPCKPAS